jgi:hypothetical protein
MKAVGQRGRSNADDRVAVAVIDLEARDAAAYAAFLKSQ